MNNTSSLFDNLINDNTNELQEYTNEDYQRRLRSLTQRILLIDASVIYEVDNNGFLDEISGVDFKV